MIYVETRATQMLRPWVRSLWYCCAPSVSHRYERVLPSGCMQMVVNLAQDFLTECTDELAESRVARAIVLGVRQRYETIATTDLAELAGVILEPGGFAGLFRERADLLFEQSVSLDTVWRGFRVDPLLEADTPAGKLRVLEAQLEGLVSERGKRSPLLDGALEFLAQPGARVGACAAAMRVSERRLLQVFREQVGVSPKGWLRIERFRGVLQRLQEQEEVRWADVALECGYYDQSHFIHDFRAFSGINPAAYSSARGAWSGHLMVR